MLDNTDNFLPNASWLLSPQAQNTTEQLNSSPVADGTNRENRDNCENRENTVNREISENRINLIELNSNEEQDSRENNKIVKTRF